MTAPNWILWMSAHFSPEQYLLWTRWQCLGWTLADLIIVYFLIRLSNQARAAVRRQPHRYSYALLAFTAAFVPFVFIAPTGGVLFLVELLITVPHFLLLCYLLTGNVLVYAEFLSGLSEDRAPESSRAVTGYGNNG